MIRALLRDLFPSRSTVGALRQRVHELERENAHNALAAEAYKSQLDDVRRDLARVYAERDAIQKRALRPDPTPGEARMLEIVRANPGLTAVALGKLAITAMHPDVPWNEGDPVFAAYANNEVKHISNLHKKSLVRRERSGNTYRYWATT